MGGVKGRGGCDNFSSGPSPANPTAGRQNITAAELQVTPVNGSFCDSRSRSQTPSDDKSAGTSFQKALRAIWGEARPGFGVHWCFYTNGHRSPSGLRDARKGIGVRQVSVLKTSQALLNVDTLAGSDARKGIGIP